MGILTPSGGQEGLPREDKGAGQGMMKGECPRWWGPAEALRREEFGQMRGNESESAQLGEKMRQGAEQPSDLQIEECSPLVPGFLTPPDDTFRLCSRTGIKHSQKPRIGRDLGHRGIQIYGCKSRPPGGKPHPVLGSAPGRVCQQPAHHPCPLWPRLAPEDRDSWIPPPAAGEHICALPIHFQRISFSFDPHPYSYLRLFVNFAHDFMIPSLRPLHLSSLPGISSHL